MDESVALSRTSRFAAVRACDGRISLVTIPPKEGTAIVIAEARAFAWVGTQLWWSTVERVERMTADGKRLAPIALAGVTRIVGNATSAIAIAGEVATLVAIDGTCTPLAAGRYLAVHGGKPVVVEAPAIAAAVLFNGRALAIAEPDAIIVTTSTGQRIHRVALDAPVRACRFAETAGIALAIGDTAIVAVDLRMGVVRGRREVGALRGIDLDADARHLVVDLGGDDVRFTTFDQTFASAPSPASTALEGHGIRPPAPSAPIPPSELPPPVVVPPISVDVAGVRARRMPPAPAANSTGDATAHLAALLDLVGAPSSRWRSRRPTPMSPARASNSSSAPPPSRPARSRSSRAVSVRRSRASRASSG